MNTITMDINLIIIYCVTLGVVICYAYYLGYTNYKHKIKKDIIKDLQINHDKKLIKLLFDSAMNPDKKILDKITDILLVDDESDRLKILRIKKIVQAWLKKEIGDES